MEAMIDEKALDRLFLEARSYYSWKDKDVADQTLKDLIELMKMGPTSFNSLPARVIFVKSSEEKEKLLTCVMPGNTEKIKLAPVCAIMGYDREFYQKLPKFFPHQDVMSVFKGNDDLIENTAYRNGTLQGGYFIIAARALGLDCGAISGFDNDAVDRLFFPCGTIRTNFLCNLGYGDSKGLFPRSPRPDFQEIASII